MTTPDADALQRARQRLLPDVLSPGLQVVFCGINPSLYSAAVGHHYARPGNRFWPALHGSGWTDRALSAAEDRLAPEFGFGLTNLVARPTARAAELSKRELTDGVAALAAKIEQFAPRRLALLGLDAFRTAFQRKHARVGPASFELAGAEVWALPNPSGLNAHYQLPDFVRLFADLRAPPVRSSRAAGCE